MDDEAKIASYLVMPTAGQYLDNCAALYGLERGHGESDDSLRIRVLERLGVVRAEKISLQKQFRKALTPFEGRKLTPDLQEEMTEALQEAYTEWMKDIS